MIDFFSWVCEECYTPWHALNEQARPMADHRAAALWHSLGHRRCGVTGGKDGVDDGLLRRRFLGVHHAGRRRTRRKRGDAEGGRGQEAGERRLWGVKLSFGKASHRIRHATPRARRSCAAGAEWRPQLSAGRGQGRPPRKDVCMYEQLFCVPHAWTRLLVLETICPW